MRFLLVLLLAALPESALAQWARQASPGGKLNFEAYSIQAPAESAWLATSKDPYDVVFGATLSRTRTWSMTSAAFELPAPVADAEALLVQVRAQFIANSDPRRFRIVDEKGWVQELRGAVCARTYFKAEDRLAGGTGAPQYIIEATTVTCVHPDAPGLGIELGYHERYAPGEKKADAEGGMQGGGLMPFGERFIRSVKFWRPAPLAAARP